MNPPSIHVQITSDIICPWCYVGKRRVERAMRQVPEAQYKVTWHPFILDPTLSDTPESKRERLIRKFGASRVPAMESYLKQIGEREGLQLSEDGLVASTVLCHQLIYWAGQHGKQDQVVEGIFKAYFEQKKSPADQDMLLDVAEAAGLSRQDAARVLSQGEVMDEVAHEAREAQKRGVHGVPHITIFRDDQESKARRELNGAQETETLVKVFRSLLDTTSTSPPSSSPEDGQTCEDKEGGDDICPM
ncbi:MAG: thioredoxin-like protein [Piptocephalis tieghemiana]|nr:MAG: thioredoxin-like protein [Piptocephalis tieghemiana]